MTFLFVSQDFLFVGSFFPYTVLALSPFFFRTYESFRGIPDVYPGYESQLWVVGIFLE